MLLYPHTSLCKKCKVLDLLWVPSSITLFNHKNPKKFWVFRWQSFRIYLKSPRNMNNATSMLHKFEFSLPISFWWSNCSFVFCSAHNSPQLFPIENRSNVYLFALFLRRYLSTQILDVRWNHWFKVHRHRRVRLVWGFLKLILFASLIYTKTMLYLFFIGNHSRFTFEHFVTEQIAEYW